MEQLIPRFGQGFYTATDIASILDLSYPKVSYWFRKHVKGAFEVTSDYRYYYNSENVTAVSFYTLIEIYVFNFFRENKISTQKIIQAHKELSKYLKNPFPFCRSDILLLSGRDIVFRLVDIFAISGTGFQQAIKEYILPYSKKIEFVDGFADKYYPLGKERSVVVNPKNQFGSPIIDGTNIKVSSISSLYRGGENIDFISRLYDISTQQVKDAIDFDKAA